jgi:glutathione S-transferase
MRLYQIPFSHNSIKVRHVLDLKGVDHERESINPARRGEIKKISGQELVPVLVDGDKVVSGSTPILLYVEDRFPQPRLLPEDPQELAECRVLMDWADSTFMALTRRLAYFQVLSDPAQLGELFFPGKPAAAQRIAGRGSAMVLRRRFGINEERNRRDEASARHAACVAVDRLGGADHLIGGSLSLADITLAAMVAPLQYTRPEVRSDPHVRTLLDWSSGVLGKDFSPVGTPAPAAVPA